VSNPNFHCGSDTKDKILAWNPFNVCYCSPFFDKQIMFGIKEGFDVVIGNPPYVSAPTMVDSNLQLRQAIINSKQFVTLYQKWDLYIPFMELGIQLLAPQGQFAMIVPYPLTNQTYAKKLREFIVNEYNLIEIVDLNGTKVFENATISNCILFISKSPPNDSCFISHINENKEIMRTFRQLTSDLVPYEKTSVWNLAEGKRETNRHFEMNVLGDFCYISYGLRPNSDEKTARGEFIKKDLISEAYDPIHCRKYIEAKDIERYRVKKIRYLEYNTKRSPDKLVRPTFREFYEHPKLMANRLGNLQVFFDKDKKFLHNDSLIGSVLWKDLKGINNKSISASVKRYSRFSRKKMEALSEQMDLRYLLGLLNSKYASTLLSNIRGGDYHIYPEHLRNLPVPAVPPSIQQPVIDLVDKILAAKAADPKADTSTLERQIDNLVYRLYDLTHEEVKVIEPEFPMSRTEYEGIEEQA
jgi:adenine-specific DNA-methyltransferase